MSAERSTESLIDLLYGELSEEESAEVREGLLDAPDLRAEFEEFESLLGRVREAMPSQDVSPTVHDAIMAAARAGVQHADDDRIIRRAPPAEQSFWSRVSRGQGSQIALVAAVLIAGLFVVRFVEKGTSMAPASDISAAREPAPAMVAPSNEGAAGRELQVAEQEAPDDFVAAEGGEAIADQWSAEADEAGASGTVDKSSNDVAKSLEAELARRDAPAKSPPPADEPPRRLAKAKSTPTMKPSAKSAKKKDASERAFDLDVLGDDDADAVGAAVSTPRTTSSTRQGSDARGKSGLDYAPAAAAAEAAPEPEPVQQLEEKEEQAREYRAPKGSIEEVAQYMRVNDYGNTIRAADAFLQNSPDARPADKASAMHYKAQALAKQGKYSQAERLLENLKTAYPAYQSSAINELLSEVKAKRAPRKEPAAKQRKASEIEKSAPAEDSIYFDSK